MYANTGGLASLDEVPSDSNAGYWYIVDPTVAEPYYRINDDLKDTGSAFYIKQCGFPSEFISGEELLEQTKRHEYDHTVNSRLGFTNSRFALEDAAHNYGVYAEGQVVGPHQNLSQYIADVGAAFQAIWKTLLDENGTGPQAASSLAHTTTVYSEESDNRPISATNKGRRTRPRVELLTMNKNRLYRRYRRCQKLTLQAIAAFIGLELTGR